jgi:hypothetical protein
MGGKSVSSAPQNTTNQDNRIAVQDGIGVGAGGSFFAQDNSTDTDIFTDSRTFSDARTFDYSDASTTNITTLDGGAIAQAFGFGNNTAAGAFDFGNKSTAGALGFGTNTVNKALATVEMNNAAVGQGFTQLLGAAESLFNRGESLIGQTQKSVADAYGMAQTDAKGTIDNRTITVLAVAGVAAAFLLSRGK